MKKLVVWTFAAAMITFVSISIAKVADPNAPKAGSMMVKGKISVTKDKEGHITAVHLHNIAKGMFYITLDAKGKELGEKMNGKTVEVTAMETVKDKEKWLTVEKYIEVQNIEKKPRSGY
jgi:hypothetical protein